MTTHLHISHWWSKSTLPNTTRCLQSIHLIPWNCHCLAFFPFPQTESILKGQQFASIEEVTSKAMKSLTEVSKNSFLECFQKLYKLWQNCVTAQENYFE
jgi:hypothetical protein